MKISLFDKMDNTCFTCITRSELYKIAQERNLKKRKKLKKYDLFIALFGEYKFCEKHSSFEDEIWKSIENADDHEISNYGRVRTKNTFNIHDGYENNEGYIYYLMKNNDGIKNPKLAHRLTAIAFIENTNNFLYVDHIDKNKSNNKVKNLRWVNAKTNSENRNNSDNIGARRKIYQLDKNTEEIIKEWSSISEASKALDISASAIRNVLKKKRLTAAGYKWKYVPYDVLEDEVWKKIPMKLKFDYYVSNKGRIKNKNTNKITLGTKSNDYRRTQLKNKSNKRLNFLIHRIVALTFFGEHPEDKPYVNHIDGNTFNNATTNLEYVDAQENSDHAVMTGLKSATIPVICYDKESIKISEFPSISKAIKKFNTTPYQIKKSIHNGKLCSKGYHWKFKNA